MAKQMTNLLFTTGSTGGSGASWLYFRFVRL